MLFLKGENSPIKVVFLIVESKKIEADIYSENKVKIQAENTW